MKTMQLDNSSQVLRLCKYGFAAMGFFMGTLQAMAQEEVDQEEATEVVAAPKKQAKPVKTYPTIEV